ncbi:MAG TPA: hypothetical protein VK911_06140 [Vicinamibacterales bacterium]|nr:hypothetical protein [Vicinamibacterales bacterium]
MGAEEATHDQPGGWMLRNRWKLVVALGAVASGFWWGRSRRRPTIDVERVSEQWLAEHTFESGRHPE